MKIDSELVKKLRMAQPWTQEELSDACGLDLRTIQRIENKGNASIESVRAVAAVFEVDPNDLLLIEKAVENDTQQTPFDAIKSGFIQFADFSGTATRFEYWWFFLFVLLITAVAAIIDYKLYLIVSVIILLPLIAAGTRRLHDIGQSGWWQVLFLVPFGFVIVFSMFALESKVKVTAIS